MTTSVWPSGPLHAVQRRYLAEDLVRLRRSDEQRRDAVPKRAAKIDPNPHQIEAVIFALGRLREGGCILADEVGLGKTIETGLVIAQMPAESTSQVLLVAPKPLLGQWRQELFTMFGLEAPGRLDFASSTRRTKSSPVSAGATTSAATTARTRTCKRGET